MPYLLKKLNFINFKLHEKKKSNVTRFLRLF